VFVFAIRIEHPLDLSVQCPHEPNSSEHCRAAQRRDQDQGLHRCLPFLCLVNGDWKPGDVIAGVLKGDKLATAGQGDRSSKARDQSATIPPRRADVGAAMIAHGAKHPGLQISKGHVVGKAASVDLSVVVTVWIAAVDEHVVTPVASHIRERSGLIVKQQVRDRPGHARIKARLDVRVESPYALGLDHCTT
jgi:hypothetical protein